MVTYTLKTQTHNPKNMTRIAYECGKQTDKNNSDNLRSLLTASLVSKQLDVTQWHGTDVHEQYLQRPRNAFRG